MSNARVGAEQIKVVTEGDIAVPRVGAEQIKVAATSTAIARVGTEQIKVLCQYPQPYKDGGNALKEPKARLRNSKTVSN